VPRSTGDQLLECVVNVSEGRDSSVISAIASAGGDQVLDVHSDPDHHRSVITLGGAATEQAAREVARRTVDLIDFSHHSGVHPRIGVLDVVPFVPLGPRGSAPVDGDLAPALRARDDFANWAASDLGLPCFLYGPERELPEVRRRAFVDLAPDRGPKSPHPTAGACAVGARFPLVAYNLWLSTADREVAASIARQLRGDSVRALGLVVGDATQVSCNLLRPMQFGPAECYDAVERLSAAYAVEVTRAELVGLVPAGVFVSTPPERRGQLDLDPDRTIEARLEAALE